MTRKLWCSLLVVGLILGVFPIALCIASTNVSATSDTHTWDGGGANALASTKENWVGDVAAPEAGDAVVFDAGALACTWDLAITLSSFTMEASYSGTMTVAAASDWGTTGDIAISSGVFTSSSTSAVTCAGNFTYAGTTLTPGVLKLDMSGTNKNLQGGATWGSRMRDLTISGATTLIGNELTTQSLTVSGTLNADQNIHLYMYDTYGFSNTGSLILSANKILKLESLSNLAPSIVFGSISGGTGSYVHLYTQDGSSESSIVSLTEDTVIGESCGFVIDSSDSAKTMTLDLTTNNYSLSSNGVIIGTKGVLNGRNSNIVYSSDWDSANGTFNQNTSSVLMNSGGYAKISSTQQFHNLVVNGTGSRLFVATDNSMRIADNLTVNGGCSASLQNNSYVMTSLVNNGIITQNSKRLNITGSSTTPLTGYGTFDGNLYLNGSTASSYQVQTGLPMGNLYFDRDTKINVDATRYLQAVPASTEFVDVSIKSIGTEQGYAARWTGTSTGPVTYTVTANSNELYDIWVDHTTRVGVVQTSDDGIVQFTYNGPFSTHEFTISKSSGPPNDLGASFEYTIEGNQVRFTDKSYGGAVSWLWNFGDGTGSTSQNPTHKYMASGEYTISLTVYDSNGMSSTAKTTITLELGPDFPVERSPQGWNVYVTQDLTLSLSAVALLVVGSIAYISAIFMPYFPVATPKGRKIIGALMVLAGLYFLIFIDNSWMRF